MIFPDDVDGDVLRRMQDSGFDFSVPHPVEFFAVFADAEAAKRVAEQYIDEHKRGGEQLADVRTTGRENGETELCIAKTMHVTYEAVTAFEARLTERAVRNGGRPEGWGVLQD